MRKDFKIMNTNTYTYKAKRIEWEDNKENQYVTGNIVTVNNRYFIVNPKIVTDCGFTGLSFDSGFTEIDKDTIEQVINPAIDKKKEILIKIHSELTDLWDATTDEELAALCDACDYDYDTLSKWNEECEHNAYTNIDNSDDFVKALNASYNDNDALFDFAREYKKSITRKNN